MIDLFRTERPKQAMEDGTIDVDGRIIPVRFRVNARARRLILRVDALTGGAVVTVPAGVGREAALQFARARGVWVLERLDKAPPPVVFEDGVIVPFLGADHVVRHQPGQRQPVICGEGKITVGGQPEHLSRRFKTWLRKQARQQVENRVIRLSEQVGKRHGRISIRDTRSRWGSCSSTGALNFSWRLVLAPEWVLEYVVAHEVAHLVEHNHSPAFWAVVGQLNDDASAARDWLGMHGEALHRYG